MPGRLLRQLIILVAAVVAAGAYYAQHRPEPSRQYEIGNEGGPVASEDLFSPAQNLERADVSQIQQAQRSLDIAMYAFTDRYIAQEIVKAAQRGVTVRVYRDRGQYEQEQERAGDREEGSSTQIMARESNIHIRVKNSKELMHLKAYLVDDRLLRDGSANWSPSGLKRQDNNAHFTTDPQQVEAFRRAFEQMWDRADNQHVQ